MQNTALKSGSPEWHANRRTGIGGSDAAAVLGLSKWKTPHQLYLEKIGEVEPEDETWEMARGKTMEPLLRQHYADTTRRTVLLPGSALRHDKYPFMTYNPDGLADDRLVEFKTAAYGREWGEVGTDEIPQEYLLQVQHGMIVTRRSVTDVTVSIAGNKPKYFVVEADKEVQEMIIEQEVHFWDMVQGRTPPAAISNEDCARIYKAVKEMRIIANAEIMQRVAGLKAIRAEISALEASKEKLEVEIKTFMGENDTLIHETGAILVTWKGAKGAERLDGKAVKENEPDIYERYLKIGDPTRRFLIK